MRRVYEELWSRQADLEVTSPAPAHVAFLRGHLPRGARVLDLGAGRGAWIEPLRASGAGEIVAVDVAEAALAYLRQSQPDVDARRVPFDGPLPFARGEFGAVWCADTLEHAADTERFLTEVRRVLRPDAPMLIITPDHPRLRTAAIALTRFERHFHPLGDHLRFYTRRSLHDVLADAGFRDITIERRKGHLLAACAS